jgi:regulator of replication initiation timing
VTVRVFFDPHRVDQLRQQGISPRRQLSAPAPEARTALELVEECARLRAENVRLREEVARLKAESSHRSTPQREERALDDAAQRFSLLELDE